MDRKEERSDHRRHHDDDEEGVDNVKWVGGWN